MENTPDIAELLGHFWYGAIVKDSKGVHWEVIGTDWSGFTAQSVGRKGKYTRTIKYSDPTYALVKEGTNVNQ